MEFHPGSGMGINSKPIIVSADRPNGGRFTAESRMAGGGFAESGGQQIS